MRKYEPTDEGDRLGDRMRYGFSLNDVRRARTSFHTFCMSFFARNSSTSFPCVDPRYFFHVQGNSGTIVGISALLGQLIPLRVRLTCPNVHSYPVPPVGTCGLLLLRSLEDSRGGHDGREVNGQRRSCRRSPEYHEGVGLLPNRTGMYFKKSEEQSSAGG